MPSDSARTSTCSGSSSPTTRWRRSRAWDATTGGSSAVIRTPTRRCDPPVWRARLPPAPRRCIVGGGATGRCAVQANVGDQLVIESNRVDAPRKIGEILEVQGDDGAPPYVVRWADGHQGVMYPGADAHVVPRQRG